MLSADDPHASTTRFPALRTPPRRLALALALMLATLLAPLGCQSYDSPPTPSDPDLDTAESVALDLIRFNFTYKAWRAEKEAAMFDWYDEREKIHDRFFASAGPRTDARRELLADKREIWDESKDAFKKVEDLEVEGKPDTDPKTGYVTVTIEGRIGVFLEVPDARGLRDSAKLKTPTYRFEVVCVEIDDDWRVKCVREVTDEDDPAALPAGYDEPRFASFSIDTFLPPPVLDASPDHSTPASIVRSYLEYLAGAKHSWQERAERASMYAEHLELIGAYFADPTPYGREAVRYELLPMAVDRHRDKLVDPEILVVDVRRPSDDAEDHAEDEGGNDGDDGEDGDDAEERDEIDADDDEHPRDLTTVTAKIRDVNLRWGEEDMAWMPRVTWRTITLAVREKDGKWWLDKGNEHLIP